jgi:single-strand DNA-binding protein
MSLINEVKLLGNVGKEPVIHQFDNGDKIASFSLATTENGYTNKSGVQIPELTEWHNIVVHRESYVNVVQQYIHKGTKLFIRGEIHTRQYNDKQNVQHRITEIWCNEFKLLGSPQQQQAAPAPVPTAAPMQKPAPTPIAAMQPQQQAPQQAQQRQGWPEEWASTPL